MKQFAILGLAAFVAPVAAHTSTLPAPLPEKDGDGRVVTSRANRRSSAGTC